MSPLKNDIDIDINPNLCVFCGLCEIFCPFNAIKVYVDDKPISSALKSGTLLEVLREVEIDEETCMRINLLCEKLCLYACPLNVIQFNETRIRIENAADCPACGWCQAVCRSVIKVRKAFKGSIRVGYEKCPEGCKICFYACPVNAICLDEDGKVSILEEFCIFCGACKNNCPENNVITISITQVNTKGLNIWKDLAERLLFYTPAKSKKSAQMMKVEIRWPRMIIDNDQSKLRIERKTYLRRHALELDKNKCRKCQICHIICPKAAISIKRLESNMPE
ncbi:MAG: 4Fe-4S binding protein [Candidatus Bathyarchaeia archaeon]